MPQVCDVYMLRDKQHQNPRPLQWDRLNCDNDAYCEADLLTDTWTVDCRIVSLIEH